MKVLIQRVTEAAVSIVDKQFSSINRGILALVGIEKGDTLEVVEKLANKLLNMRIFSDDAGKMNLSIKDINGELLVVSQFTLCANCKKGTRPSFDNSAEPVLANDFYEKFVEFLKMSGLTVMTGQFGANMQISLVNDGPVTFMLEAKNE